MPAEVAVPEQVIVSMAEIAGAAREGLLALAVSTGVQVMTAMFDEDVIRLCGWLRHPARRLGIQATLTLGLPPATRPAGAPRSCPSPSPPEPAPRRAAPGDRQNCNLRMDAIPSGWPHLPEGGRLTTDRAQCLRYGGWSGLL